MLHIQKKSSLLFGIGCVLIILTLLPSLFLGENAIYTYHDQLDGEVIAYILQARHLWDGRILPEFLGGASKTALMPPAPACILLFRVFSPLKALYLMQLLGCVTGYAGMYLLVYENTESDIAAFVAGGLYGIIPFLPVYGLSQYGLPLLLWCVLRLREGRGRRAFCLAYGMLYALNSSLILVGFAVLAVLAIWIVRDRIRKKAAPIPMVLLWGTMTAIYLAENFALILQVLGIGDQEVSHKTEYVLGSENLWRGFLQGFLEGGQYSTDRHIGILGVAVLILIAEEIRVRRSGVLQKEGVQRDRSVTVIRWCLGCNAAFAGISALWNCSFFVGLKEHMGAAGAFQLDRFLWLAPCLWYLVLGCCMAYVWKFRAIAAVLVCLIVSGMTGFTLLKESDIKSNLQKLRNSDYPMLSYSEYYAIGVLDQVRDYLERETGLTQEAYRVVSLGIDPAAALYHGFYCLDGYSNNYALDYKHAFRKVIAPALAESDYLRAYFDEWGNRCYLFGTECPGYYTIEKNGFYFQHLELDTKALRDLGGDYLLSAAYIANSEELGLVLLREEPFETQDSYYRIFLYEVADEER